MTGNACRVCITKELTVSVLFYFTILLYKTTYSTKTKKNK